MLKNKIWWITQSQIANGDIDSALRRVEPEQLAEAEIYGLAGAVRLRIENANGPADLFCNPVARTFFRALYQRWPWTGYFLRIAPITALSPLDQITDVSVFMALAFCHVDELTYVQSSRGTALRYNGDQLTAHLADLRGRAAQLAEVVDIDSITIRTRDALISQSVASFFRAGQDLHTKTNKRK